VAAAAQGSDASTARAGMVCLRSRSKTRETVDRLLAAVVARGMTVFARIDHGAGAAEAGLTLGPTELLVFGNARGGTSMMQAAQSAGIDLPLKALVWEDASGTVWVGYNDPDWVARRHGLNPEDVPTLHSMREGLAAVAREASGDVASHG